MSNTSSPSASLDSLVSTVSKPKRLSYGWWMVLTSAWGLFWGVPLTVYSFSVFLKPLMLQFHAGRSAVSLAFTLHLIAAASIAPVVGWLIDRHGSRKIILLGTTLFGLTLLANRAFSGSIGQLYLLYVFLGLTLHATGPIPYSRVITHWFDRRRGLALGLMMLGIGLGAIVMPLLALQLILRLGVHLTYAVLGGAVLLVSIPVVGSFLKETPQEVGFELDGLSAGSAASQCDAASSGLAAAEAWRAATFWLMLAAFALVGASVQGCLVHMTAMLTDRGMNVQSAALGTSLMGGAVLLGRVGTGYLLDRLFAPRVAATVFAGSALGIAFLLRAAPSLAFVGAFLVGLALGAELDFIPFLTSRYFGLRAFGAIYSSLFAAFALTGALGPLLMGAGFDSTGSYRGPLLVFFASTLIAAALMLCLGPYRYQAAGIKSR